MPGAHVWLKDGPDTREVSAAVTGGQLLEFDSANIGKVKPAGAGSLVVAGVAAADAQPAGSNPTSPLNISWPQSQVAVIYGPRDVHLTYASAANPGDPLKAAADGQVTKWVTGTDTDTRLIVAICTATAAVSSGAVARARLRV